MISKNLFKLVIVRHGDRADCSNDPKIKALVENECNTPLDPTKVNTINKTGILLRKILSSKKTFDKIISSPYDRCVSTTLGLVGSTSDIEFNGNISEIMNSKLLKQNFSLVPPIIKNNLINKFGISNDIVDNIVFPQGEETRGTGGCADARFRSELNNIALKSISEGLDNTLVVTHGDCLSSAMSFCNPNLYVYSVDYCGIVVLIFDKLTKKCSISFDECAGIGYMTD